MSEIFIYNKKISSIFQLLGEKENNISYSVGWALANSNNLLDIFLRATINWQKKYNPEDVNIRLQKHEQGGGFTDFEIELPGYFYLIIEAKRGWNFPLREQLTKYANRKGFKNSKAKIKKIIILNEASQEYSHAHFDIGKIDKINTICLSWKNIYDYSKKAKRGATHSERNLLLELNNYLENIMTMQKIDSNLVYCVSLGGQEAGSKISNIDIVRKKLHYWHPIGNRWPDPPNYFAFRYGGKLQSIHHVEKYEVITNPHTVIKEFPDAKWVPHYFYTLGEGFKPDKDVPNGRIYPAGKHWIMIDTFFICNTVKDAINLTKKRMEEI